LERDYSGVSIKLDSAAGPLSVLVAEVSGGNQLVHSILREFVFDIAWYVPPFVALALLLAAFSVRRSLLPLRKASTQASAIGPKSITLRYPRPMCQSRHSHSSSPSIMRSTGWSKDL
jgi:hypothetical protein